MFKSHVIKNILQKSICGVSALLLLVLGFLLWTLRSQHCELITLRAAYVSDQSDLESMRKRISDLSMGIRRAAIHAQRQEQALKQYEKMVEEEKSLFGDSIIRRDYILDENDPFVALLTDTTTWPDGYYNSEGYYEYANKSVIYSDHWIVSYKLDFDTAWGHGTTRVKVGTINRNIWLDSFYRFEKPVAASNSYFLSRRLRLSDIVAKDDIPRMTALLIEPFKNELDKKGFKYEIKEDGSLHTGFPMPKPTENFYYDKDGLHFVYESYEIHCGAAGSFDLCIEWPLPESVVWGHRGAGTRELPEEWPISLKIAPLPEKEDFELEEADLPIYVSGPLSDAPDAIVRFPPSKRDEGQSGHSEHDGIFVTKELPAYYEQLNAFIRPKWNAVAPTDIKLNVSTWPAVDLSIAKDGHITKASIVRKSGFKAIDDAVDVLLADLKIVPMPPQAAEIHIVLEIQ